MACRVQGSRLYGKPLQHLVNGGITVIESLMEYLRQIPSVRKIVLAISEEDENNGFVKLAEKYKLEYVRGDQKDVLSRIIKAADHVGTKYILRTSTECPFVLYEYVEALIRDFFDGAYDWGAYEDTPEGTGVEIIKTEALKISFANGEDRHRSELVTSYIFDHQDAFKILSKKLQEHLRRPEVRLTVDYPEDLIFCQKVYQALKKTDQLIKVEEIVEFWDRNPTLRKPLEEIGIDWGHGRVWK